MKPMLFLMIQVLFAGAVSYSQPSGIFSDHADVGNPMLTGNTAYDPETQVYNLSGAGYNIWFNRDEFHYAYNKLTGDFVLTANFLFEGRGADPHRKTGWMVRESLDEQAAHMSAVLHGDGLTVMQWRPLRGAYMRDPQDEIFAPKDGYSVLQLERAGDVFIFRAAMPGEALQEIGRKVLPDMPDEVLAGLFITSHAPAVKETARIWNVRIDKPVPETYDPYTSGWMGCRLEIMDAMTGERRVIHESAGRFEAPNWMPAGDKLLFNQDGLLYTIPTGGGDPVLFRTGFANRLNNDHGISFDGKWLAISHHRDDKPGGGSSIYVLPLAGGEPQLVTEGTPSYFHGWMANNREVLYVARRESSVYNVYKCATDGGKEVQLTHFTLGHVDGPEGSPDGRYIYYNGSQSGTMQLWRMKPDGSGAEQLTFDEYNDWFPHISPDGKWILFLSYPPDIDPDSHPSFKRVMLRMMPASGGAPRVVAYLYGGQGSINVPSWSPDSRRVAFVSNSSKAEK